MKAIECKVWKIRGRQDYYDIENPNQEDLFREQLK